MRDVQASWPSTPTQCSTSSWTTALKATARGLSCLRNIWHHRPQHCHHQQLVRSSWPITNITIINVQSTLHRFLGIVLLLEFILFDCLRLFFIFLTGCHSECDLFNLISWQMVPSSSEWIVSLWKDAFNALLFRNGHVDLCSTLSQSDPRCAHAQELHQGCSLWYLRNHQNYGDFPRHSWPPLWESLTSPSVPAILSFRSPQTQPQ